MTTLEFSKRRRTSESRYKVGDKVWFDYVTFDSWRVVHTIKAGIILYLPDKYSCHFGVRPLDTPKGTFCSLNVLAKDMRKFRKNEVVPA